MFVEEAPVLRHVWAHCFEDKANMISIWTSVLEIVEKAENVVSVRMRSTLLSYVSENTQLEGIVSLPERVGSEDFQRDVFLGAE